MMTIINSMVKNGHKQQTIIGTTQQYVFITITNNSKY